MNQEKLRQDQLPGEDGQSQLSDHIDENKKWLWDVASRRFVIIWARAGRIDRTVGAAGGLPIG